MDTHSEKYFQGSRSAAQVCLSTDDTSLTPNSQHLACFECRDHWKAVDPFIEKKSFTEKEDNVILRMKEDGKSWADMSAVLPGRPGDHIRRRYLDVLDPALKKNVPWSIAEDRILLDHHHRLGNQWTEFSKMLPGRSPNNIKSHWSYVEKRKRKKRKLLVLKQHSAALQRQYELTLPIAAATSHLPPRSPSTELVHAEEEE